MERIQYCVEDDMPKHSLILRIKWFLNKITFANYRTFLYLRKQFLNVICDSCHGGSSEVELCRGRLKDKKYCNYYQKAKRKYK